MVFLLKRFKRE